MSSVVLISLFCSVIIIFVGVAGLVYILGTHRKSKKIDIQTGAEEASHSTTQAGFVRWISLIGIALVLALWNVVFALFFLAVVWVLRLNPGPGSNYRLDQDQKDTARRVYTWLFLSPIITVPTFTGLLNYSYWGNSRNGIILAALLPLIFHVPLLAGLTSKNVFVYRHTQQGILLIALRAGMAALTVSIGGTGLFYIGNGALWLLGTIWGRNQVIRGECWWMRQREAQILTSETAHPPTSASEEQVIDDEFKDPINFINSDGNEARQKALTVFRNGTPKDKKKAVQILSQLGEVEKF